MEKILLREKERSCEFRGSIGADLYKKKTREALEIRLVFAKGQFLSSEAARETWGRGTKLERQNKIFHNFLVHWIKKKIPQKCIL